MTKTLKIITLLPATFLLFSCGNKANPQNNMTANSPLSNRTAIGKYTINSKISEVISDSDFGDYGRLIFPADNRYYSGDTLGNLRLTWYDINTAKTVEIINYMKYHAASGDKIFFDIYTEEEKAANPSKANTGLFFFKGKSGEKFAICNAGGAFAYVGAMQDSFPHAL